jgi:hypothetical protein
MRFVTRSPPRDTTGVVSRGGDTTAPRGARERPAAGAAAVITLPPPAAEPRFAVTGPEPFAAATVGCAWDATGDGTGGAGVRPVAFLRRRSAAGAPAGTATLAVGGSSGAVSTLRLRPRVPPAGGLVGADRRSGASATARGSGDRAVAMSAPAAPAAPRSVRVARARAAGDAVGATAAAASVDARRRVLGRVEAVTRVVRRAGRQVDRRIPESQPAVKNPARAAGRCRSNVSL